MRSTKATAAVERLKRRSGVETYAMVMMSGGLFRLVDRAASPAELSAPLQLDAFVAFVDGFGPRAVVKKSKLDDAFEAQIKQSRK